MQSSLPSQILLRQSTILKKTISNTSSTANPDPTQEISDTFSKIHDTIDNLDSKVQAVLDKHEIEFLFAWQNHIKKIKNELREIKDRSDEKEKLMNSNERMMAMEKQMALFRDESLRLYEEVQERKNELQVLKRRLKESDIELQVLRQENKQLIKGTKLAEAKFIIEHQKLIQLQKELQNNKQLPLDQSEHISTLNMITVDNKNFTQKNLSIVHNRTLGFENYNLSAVKSTEKTGLNFEKKTGVMTLKEESRGDSFMISKLKQHKLNRLSVTNKWQSNGFDDGSKQKILQEEISRPKKMSLQMNPTSTKTHNFMMIEPSIYENQLKNWFLQCIKSIKKQISSRKSGFTSPAVEIMKVQSLEEFKTIDKLRLLEMFLENEKLLVYMYQKVFPDRLKEIQVYLNQQVGRGKKMSNVENSEQEDSRKRHNRTISHSRRQKQEHVKLDGVSQNDLDIGLLQETGDKKFRQNSKMRVKSVSKATKSQPIRNRIVMRDGKLNLLF